MVREAHTSVASCRGIDLEGSGGHELNNMRGIKFYAIILPVVSIYAVLSLLFPIHMGDTDTWYHLAGGRYFFNHLQIAGSAYFSFLHPDAVMTNYYYLFQLISFGVFKIVGYHGLLAMRVIVILSTLILIYKIFLPLQKDNNYDINTSLMIYIPILMLIASCLIRRQLVVRPHLFSYFFIVLFIYILDRHDKLIILLPFVGMLWMNIHGIQYPVMLVILFAYLVESIYRSRREPGNSGIVNKRFILIIITCYTLFLTPHFTNILAVPFTIAEHQEMYIRELVGVNIREFFTLDLLPARLSDAPGRNLLLLLDLAAIALCAVRGNIRVSSVLLFMAGLALLMTYPRCIAEFALLSIPLLNHAIPLLAGCEVFRGFRARVAVGAVLAIIPACFLYNLINARNDTLEHFYLPVGSVQLLNKLDVGGNVFNHPDTGGYLEWGLSDKYRITADLQMSLFDAADITSTLDALSDATALDNMTRKYDVRFISVPTSIPRFGSVVSSLPRFRLIYFDQAEALYADGEAMPMLVKELSIESIDPYKLESLNPANKSPETLLQMNADVQKLLHAYDRNLAAKIIAGDIFLAEKKPDLALSTSKTIIGEFPENSAGYLLKARSCLELKQVVEAEESIRLALKKIDCPDVAMLLFTTLLKTEKYSEAYRVISKKWNPFLGNTPTDVLVDFGNVASALGNMKDALLFFGLAEEKTRSDDLEGRNKIRNYIEECQAALKPKFN